MEETVTKTQSNDHWIEFDKFDFSKTINAGFVTEGTRIIKTKYLPYTSNATGVVHSMSMPLTPNVLFVSEWLYNAIAKQVINTKEE